MSYRQTARLLLLSLFLLASTSSNAQTNDDDRAYDETARVARISLIKGDVSLRRAGQGNWERATLNYPLVEGDRLATGAEARVELQIDARNFVRVGAYATLDVVTLRAEGLALSLPEGTASIRLVSFDSSREYFEVDAPQTTLAAEQPGLYRLDVAQNGRVRVTVRDGARARLYAATSGFTLRAGRSAELAPDISGAGDWDFSAAADYDEWDRWNSERETYLGTRLRYDDRARYYDDGVWGAEELDAYGDWVNTRAYGYVWRPHAGTINSYHDWAPYRYGHWTYCPPYGWTWVGDEPWGWAPYHYGRWVYQDNYWCWAPRGYDNYHQRSWWRPALVAFVSFGNAHDANICWYPLGYHQPDPHARRYRHADRLAPLRSDQVAGLQRTNPIYQRAVTALPAREFANGGGRGRPASVDLAQRALITDPVRGRLPIRPADDGADNAARAGADRARPRAGGAARTDPAAPVRTLPERQTGAAARQPGTPLDAELRRGRIFNGREPRVVVREPAGGAVNNDPNERPTGVVVRPPRPSSDADRDHAPDATPSGKLDRPDKATDRRERRPVERRADSDGGGDTNNAGPRPDFRTLPPARTDVPADRPMRREPPRVAQPAESNVRPAERPDVRRAEPPRERVAPRPERPAEPPHRAERAAPPPREERSAPREERAAPTREERRPDPPRQREAPARHERPDPPGAR